MTCKATENAKNNCFNLLSRFWDLPLSSPLDLQIGSSMGCLPSPPLWVAGKRRKDGCWSVGAAVFGPPLEVGWRRSPMAVLRRSGLWPAAVVGSVRWPGEGGRWVGWERGQSELGNGWPRKSSGRPLSGGAGDREKEMGMLDVLWTLIAVKREKEGCVGFGRAVRGRRRWWSLLLVVAAAVGLTAGCKRQMTRRWGKLSKGVLCAAGKGGRTGLREGRLVPWPSKKKNEIPKLERGAAALLEKNGFRVRSFFCIFFWCFPKLSPPPLFELWTSIYR